MPKISSGSFRKRANGWQYRFRVDGKRVEVGGFATRKLASEAMRAAIDAARRGSALAEDMTLRELAERYLAIHAGEENTVRTLGYNLVRALDAFGDRRVAGGISVGDVKAWRVSLPARTAHNYHKAFRQLLNYAMAEKLISENVAALVANPKPKRRELRFLMPDEVEAIAAELKSGSVIPVFAAWTGLRPEEWLPLERRDIDREAGVVHVRRVFTDGRIKEYAKTDKALRTVPLPLRARLSLDGLPPRLDTPLLFPGARGGVMDLAAWRRNHWGPALRAAGIAYMPPKQLRHSFASWAIAAGVPVFELSRLMGTGVKQIDETYGHLVRGAVERARDALDTFGVRAGSGERNEEVEGGA